MRKSAKLITLQQEADSAWQRYSEASAELQKAQWLDVGYQEEADSAWQRYSKASAELQKAQWLDVEHQQMLWRRGASCNMELLREKGIAPPKEETAR